MQGLSLALAGPGCIVKFSSFLLTGCPCHLFGMGQVEEKVEAVLCQHCSNYQSSFSRALTTVSALLANSCGAGSGEYLCLFPGAVLTASCQHTTSVVQCPLGFTAASDRAFLCC